MIIIVKINIMETIMMDIVIIIVNLIIIDQIPKRDLKHDKAVIPGYHHKID
jgi:hypothetical protein